MRQASLAGCHRRRRRPRTTIADPAASPAPNLVQRISIRWRPTSCGWRTSPPSRPERGGFIWPRCSMPSAGASSGGPWPTICAPSWCSTRSPWPWRPAGRRRADPPLGPRLPVHLARLRALPASAGLVPSMSRVANCWDNAVAERFFATLKGVLVDRQAWPTRARPQVPSSTTSKASTTASAGTRRSAISASPPTKPPISPRRSRRGVTLRNECVECCRTRTCPSKRGNSSRRPGREPGGGGPGGHTLSRFLARDAPTAARAQCGRGYPPRHTCARRQSAPAGPRCCAKRRTSAFAAGGRSG